MRYEIEKNTVSYFRIPGSDAILVRINRMFLYDVQYNEWSKLDAKNEFQAVSQLYDTAKTNKFLAVISLFTKGFINEN